MLTLQIGKQAIPCRCTKGAVRFDMRIFEDRASPLAVLCSLTTALRRMQWQLVVTLATYAHTRFPWCVCVCVRACVCACVCTSQLAAVTWIECDACTKWRLLADPSAVDPSRPFECTMLGVRRPTMHPRRLRPLHCAENT